MSHSRKKSLSTQLTKSSLSCMALSSVAMLATPAYAQNSVAGRSEAEVPNVTLPEIVVTATGNEFNKTFSENVKQTQPLLDTPQTIVPITQQLMKEQKAATLAEALRNVPGITMQLGENGNTSEGDTLTMRGFSNNNLFTVDGVRNIAPVPRDTFNTESIEVTKGGAGADLGRAANAGMINLVTKQPKAQQDRNLSVGVDSVGKVRVTTDINQPLNNGVAVRLNAMYDDGDIIGRNQVEKTKSGVAPSIAWGLGTKTRVFADAELLRQRNTPDGGISTVGMDGYYVKDNYTTSDIKSTPTGMTKQQAIDTLNAAGYALNHAKRIDSENFYGTKDDFENIDSQIYSLKIEHDFDNGVNLTNLTRYSKATLERELAAPYQALATDLSVSSGAVSANKDLAGTNPNNPDSWKVRVLRQGIDRENTTFANQTNLNILGVKTGNILHDFSTGIELIQEEQKYNSLANSLANIYSSLYHPNANINQGKFSPTGAKTKGSTDTLGAYVNDTIKINDKFQVMAGVRVDNYESKYESITANNATPPNVKTKVDDSDTLFSYKGAVIFKPIPQASIYANYGFTQTPPGSSNFSLANSGTSTGSNINFDPQETENWEVGGKWNILDERLSLGLAYYNTTHKNELAVTDTATGDVSQFGKRKVDGVEFTAQGKLTPKWRLNAGIQTMNTEIKKGSTGSSANGAAARWSPELTGTLWTSYDINDKFTVGGGVRYIGEQKRQVDPSVDNSTQQMPKIPDYWVADLYGSYRFSPNLSLDVNVMNVADKDYIETLNNSGNRATLGQPLNVMATVNYKF